MLRYAMLCYAMLGVEGPSSIERKRASERASQSDTSSSMDPIRAPPSPCDAHPEDSYYMQLALQEAELAYEAGEVPIGCVIVAPCTDTSQTASKQEASSRVVGRGRNRTNEDYNATRHAELVAIDAMIAASKERPVSLQEPHKSNMPFSLAGHTVYVTVEPCIMCIAALRALQLSRLVFGCSNPKFGGCGSTLPLEASLCMAETTSVDTLAVRDGVFRPAAILLLRRFYLRVNERAPKPKSKKNRSLKMPSL